MTQTTTKGFTTPIHYRNGKGQPATIAMHLGDLWQCIRGPEHLHGVTGAREDLAVELARAGYIEVSL